MSDARDLAAEILLALELKGARVRDGLDAVRERVPDSRDRGLLTELAYGVVRRQGTLDALLAPASRRRVDRLDPAARVALRLALYQVVFLQRIPDHAAVHHAVGWARGKAGGATGGYVNGVLRTVLRGREGEAQGPEDVRRDVPREDGTALRFSEPVFPDPELDLLANLSQRYSCPRWICERWRAAFGDVQLATLLRAGIVRPPVTLRARRGRDRLAVWLKGRGLEFSAGPSSDSMLIRSGETAAAQAVAEGLAWVQDATSQRVVPHLDLRSGQRVLDLCAAPGGKTVQIADTLEQGDLCASDVDAAKVAALASLAPEMGNVRFRAVQVPASGPLPFPAASLDRILVDAPCSNTGVLRRRVEARWRLRERDITALAALQLSLLQRAFPLLRPGGLLVYSTCSLEPEENEDVVAAFLAQQPRARAKPAVRVFPTGEADGGFLAAFSASE